MKVKPNLKHKLDHGAHETKPSRKKWLWHVFSCIAWSKFEKDFKYSMLEHFGLRVWYS